MTSIFPILTKIDKGKFYSHMRINFPVLSDFNIFPIQKQKL